MTPPSDCPLRRFCVGPRSMERRRWVLRITWGVLRWVNGQDAYLKKARADITKIEIPPDDPAYEIHENREEITRFANEVFAGLIRNRIDLEGLVAKSKQTTLLP